MNIPLTRDPLFEPKLEEIRMPFVVIYENLPFQYTDNFFSDKT